MSSLREKASEIKSAAEAERGNFEPTGVPLRLYKYWLGESNSKRARSIRAGGMKENFCHFWRVVALWAPLMWLRRKIEAVVTSPVFSVLALTGLVVGIVALGITFAEFGKILLFIIALAVGITLAAFGIISGMSMAMTEEKAERADLPPHRVARFGIVAIPFFLMGYGLEKMDQHDLEGVVLGVFSALLVLGLLTFMVMTEGWLFMLGFVGTILGIAVGAVLLLVIFAGIGNFISAKRRVLRNRTAEAEYFSSSEESETSEPGRASKFFTGFGDLLILVGQVLRTKKWKICPTVDINK